MSDIREDDNVPSALAAMDTTVVEDVDIDIEPIPVEKQLSILDRFYSPRMMLFLLTMISLLNCIDRGLISGMVPVIRSTVLHCTETEAGWLAGAFTVGYMISAPIFSFSGKWIRPTKLISIGMTIWILSCFFAGLSRHYWPLLLARIGSGIGEASFAGLSPACIDDNAPKSQTTTWLAIFYSTLPIGTAIGFALGGICADDWLWYAIFYIEGLFMVPFVILIFFVPVSRSASDKEKRMISKGRAGIVRDFTFVDASRRILTNSVYVLAVLGYASYTFVVGSLQFWITDYFVEGLHLRADMAAIYVGVITVLCGLVGVGSGGVILDKIGGAKGMLGASRALRLCLIAALITIPFALFTFGVAQSVWFSFLMIALAELALFATQAPVNAAILSCVDSELRSFAMALSIFWMHALGDFPSPPFTGWLIELYRMRTALSICSLILLLSALAWGIASIIAKRRGKLEDSGDDELAVPLKDPANGVDL